MRRLGVTELEVFRNLVNAVRFLSIAQVKNAHSGHLGMPLGMADVLTVLFKNFLRFDPEHPTWPNRDRFVMSGGHGSTALYSLLYLLGYKKVTLNDLKNFRQLGSKATGHPEYDPECGIEITTGPLGEGIASAVGMAIEERLLNARFGDACIKHHTYVTVGDGDLMEGVSHEACSLAGNLSLGRLIVLFDDNGITIDGPTSIAERDDTAERFKSYGWHVLSCDGHSDCAIFDAIKFAQKDPRPSIIFCKTKIGYGTPKEGTSSAHSGILSDEEIEKTKENLRWKYKEFEIPEYIEKTWHAIGKRSHEECEKWYKTQAKKYGAENSDCPAEVSYVLRQLKKECFISRPFEATRKTNQKIISKIMDVSNMFVSGSADLGSSTGCKSNNCRAITKDDFSGNYVNYGVREHAMGAIINGINARQKIRAFGGTFFVFSDYMRPTLRLSAMMNIPSIFIFSHDSIGVGEDGPTHQPIEHLAALRSIPNLCVFRPADALETIECWECALKNGGPSVVVLTRQEVLSVRFSSDENLCALGGYLLHNDSLENPKRVTLIATGSEVGIALDVKKKLNDRDISANVVSLPCWSLFDKQPIEYKRQVLGDDLRVGIEAATDFGWRKYLRESDLFFGVNNFGCSAPCSDNFNYFQLTSDYICDEIIRRISEQK